jgi:hypothetical protein
MRRLLESLMPDERQIYWKWVAGMFAVYVVLFSTGERLFVNHEPTRTLAREPDATTVATDRSITPASTTLQQAARD